MALTKRSVRMSKQQESDEAPPEDDASIEMNTVVTDDDRFAAVAAAANGETISFNRDWRFALGGVDVIDLRANRGYDIGQLDALDPEIVKIAREAGMVAGGEE